MDVTIPKVCTTLGFHYKFLVQGNHPHGRRIQSEIFKPRDFTTKGRHRVRSRAYLPHWWHKLSFHTMWGPQTIAKLVYNSNNYSLLYLLELYTNYSYYTPITQLLITIVNGVYKPTNISGGAPHCMTLGKAQVITPIVGCSMDFGGLPGNRALGVPTKIPWLIIPSGNLT